MWAVSPPPASAMPSKQPPLGARLQRRAPAPVDLGDPLQGEPCPVGLEALFGDHKAGAAELAKRAKPIGPYAPRNAPGRSGVRVPPDDRGMQGAQGRFARVLGHEPDSSASGTQDWWRTTVLNCHPTGSQHELTRPHTRIPRLDTETPSPGLPSASSTYWLSSWRARCRDPLAPCSSCPSDKTDATRCLR